MIAIFEYPGDLKKLPAQIASSGRSTLARVVLGKTLHSPRVNPGNSNSKKAVCVVKVGASLDLSFSPLITALRLGIEKVVYHRDDR